MIPPFRDRNLKNKKRDRIHEVYVSLLALIIGNPF